MKNKWYTYFALVFAIWFALTAWFWAWLANLFFSLPFGLAALILYFTGRYQVPGNRLNRAVLIILITGIAVSVTTLLIMVAF